MVDQMTADLWNVYLMHAQHGPLTPEDVDHMMTLARVAENACFPHKDTIADTEQAVTKADGDIQLTCGCFAMTEEERRTRTCSKHGSRVHA